MDLYVKSFVCEQKGSCMRDDKDQRLKVKTKAYHIHISTHTSGGQKRKKTEKMRQQDRLENICVHCVW
jgi:hypothetical protein